MSYTYRTDASYLNIVIGFGLDAYFVRPPSYVQRFEKMKDGPMEMRFSSIEFSEGFNQGGFVAAEIVGYTVID